MDENDPVLAGLRRALQAEPENVPLRLHLAGLLLGAGRNADAVSEIAQVLAADPVSEAARELMSRALRGGQAEAAGAGGGEDAGGAAGGWVFDWTAAEKQVGDIVPPVFAGEAGQPEPGTEIFSTEKSQVRLADVGGMETVKRRLEAAFLAPVRNPELRRIYGKSLRGGLLLYGPPGCGKTFIARALAGEVDARFLAVGISEVLDMYLGRSEQNLHEIFQLARRSAPCMLFFDELDALGQRRSQTWNAAIRTTVNQLLLELDNVGAGNEGVFVLGASNQPWDVDTALRRPGRFDRTVLVLPPDLAARRAILAYHLRDRPVVGMDLSALAQHTDGYSGADLAHVCDSAAERALLDAAASGTARMIGHEDLDAALAEIRPSTGSWFEAARSVAMFANQDGTYDDLAAYLRRHGIL